MSQGEKLQHEKPSKRYLRKLTFGGRSQARSELNESLESTGGAPSFTAASLTDERAHAARARAVELIEQQGQSLSQSDQDELDQVFLKSGVEALRRLRIDREDAQLSDLHVEGLEAIVETDGSRPALLLSESDEIDLEDKILSDWKDSAQEYKNQIKRVSSAVGRVDLNGKHRGTGFVVRDGLILTNRHVLQELATQDDQGTWHFSGQPTIVFDAEPDSNRTREFKLKQQVVHAGNQKIGSGALDFNKMDFAVLECEVPDNADFPESLPLENDADKVVRNRPIYALGYPGQPRRGQYKFSVLMKLFGNKFSVKRFAPGEINQELGGVTGDDKTTVFSHDATTLGGNSGSCIVDFGDDGLLVVGLHFAGMAKTENYAHSSAKLKEYLDELDLSWKDWLDT